LKKIYNKIKLLLGENIMSKQKGDALKVNPIIAKMAIETGKERKALYSQCVIISYRHTGRFAPGFDNKDLQLWIDLNYPELYDSHGFRIAESPITEVNK